MKKLFYILSICLIVHVEKVQAQKTSFHIRSKVIVNNIDNQLTKLIVILPLAQSNQYQTVSNVNVYDGTIENIFETDDKYVRWIFTDNLPAVGKSKETYYDFDVTLNSFSFDFNQITSIYAYDTISNNYLWYTGVSDVYVDPRNATIQNIGDSLWVQSSNIVAYAKLCYEYVATHFTYKNPNIGLKPLQDVLTAGGGDCGNLSSIYVSLLRYKYIPARHIVTVRPNGSYHVWADFYLEKYGWIPVDVTYKNSNIYGDYFGKYDGNGIVFTKEVWLLLNRSDGYTYHTALLQTFNWFYWISNGGNNIGASYNLSSTSSVGIQKIKADTNITVYPNPATEIITIEDLSLRKSKTKIVSIYNAQGTLILQHPMLQKKETLDISNFTKGIYIVKINDEENVQMCKIIIL